MQQRTAEWAMARVGHITGSRCAAVMSSGRSKAAKWSAAGDTLMLELIAEITTGLPADWGPRWQQDDAGEWYVADYGPLAPPAACRWGINYEADARDAYELARDVTVDEAAWVPKRGEPYIGCSPDGFIGLGGLVEIKCPATSREHIRTLLTREIPTQYLPQIQHQLWCTGRAWCDFVSYDPRQKAADKLVIVRVEAECESHAARCREFRDEMLERLKAAKGEG